MAPARRKCGARAARSLRAVRRVTFSRNYTLSLSRTCRCYCKYCAFATHRAHLYAPDEVERRLDEAVRRNAKELLVLTGERPEVNPEVAAAARSPGATPTSSPTWSGPVSARSSAGSCRTRTSASSTRERPGPAARGDRLAGADAGVDLGAADGDRPRGLADQAPGARACETIEAAGELRIPFTSGILVGIGETEEERIASLEALAAVHERHGHIQEVILQNFVPHPSYYGREVAEIADEAARVALGVEGIAAAERRSRVERPTARLGDADHARRHEAAGRASAGG